MELQQPNGKRFRRAGLGGQSQQTLNPLEESHTLGARFVRHGYVIRFMQTFYITQPNVSFAVWEQTCWSFYDIRHTLLLPIPLGSFLRHGLDSK